MNNDKVLSLLGLAKKAGKLKSGEYCVETEIKKGRAKLVIVALDASENTKKSYSDMCNYKKVPIIFYENKDNPFKSMTTYTSEENDKIWACASSTTALPLPSLMKTSFLFIFSKNFLLKILTVSFVSGKVA